MLGPWLFQQVLKQPAQSKPNQTSYPDAEQYAAIAFIYLTFNSNNLIKFHVISQLWSCSIHFNSILSSGQCSIVAAIASAAAAVVITMVTRCRRLHY